MNGGLARSTVELRDEMLAQLDQLVPMVQNMVDKSPDPSGPAEVMGRLQGLRGRLRRAAMVDAIRDVR